MTENELARQLKREGFSTTYAWQDGPNTIYPDHTHPVETAHIVLQGQVTITTEGETRTYRKGDRCDVPANTVHSAVIGPHGCRYLIGER
jgi:mannose-6-phosphate isomerase-like protein (cupin superfamily)